MPRPEEVIGANDGEPHRVPTPEAITTNNAAGSQATTRRVRLRRRRAKIGLLRMRRGTRLLPVVLARRVLLHDLDLPLLCFDDGQCEILDLVAL